MAKRRAQIAQRALPPEPDATELSDDLPTEEWIAERNARIAKKKAIAAAEARARAKNSTAIRPKK